MEEGATGLPASMAEKREGLTPMLSQYAGICADYDDALVLFQVGDFYEAFCEAAETVSRELEITLTQREDSTGTYPMAGVPIEGGASYIERLLDAGYRVAIAEQVEDPMDSSGPVDRAVTRVVTPGTVIDDDLLEPGASTYVACIASAAGDSLESADGDAGSPARNCDGTGTERETETEPGSKGEKRTYAVAFADVSAGEFLVTSADRETITDELERFSPAEVLLAPEIEAAAFGLKGADRMVTRPAEATFAGNEERERIGTADGDHIDFDSAERRACEALLAYVEYTQGTADADDDADNVDETGTGSETEGEPDADSQFGVFSRYEPTEHLRLDATALRSLEVFESRDGGDEHSLFSVLDRCSSSLGRRRLGAWLRRPLLDADAISARHDAVAELVAESLAREELREHLRDVYDLSRLVTRVSRDRANARDLRALKATLDTVPDVRETLADAESEELSTLRGALSDLGDVRGLIERAIRPDPPIEITDGGVVNPAFDADLEDLRETERGGKEWVAALEADERERTGIDSLSVGFNQVHGYYIEVTKANVENVPEEYTRRQTLKNAERYYTPDLKRREDEILSAGERADEREYRLFCAVRRRVAAEAERIDAVADALSDLDALSSLAAVATERDYVRPVIDEETFCLRGARHPVVEVVQESFVPNDLSLRPGEVAIITGPNMAGKSTYMRQVALCVLLTQIGGFVPAREARLPVVDRIFTRVGASDDIAGGQSTFMREMTELATVLRGATDRSLVILDEVGRGTSTTDGTAIARAAIEHLHDAVGARVLFATHYHELTDLATERERVSTYHFPADRDGETVTFLHSVANGVSSASYGIDVARLAGVPEGVVSRSRDLVGNTESAESTENAENTESAGETDDTERPDPLANGNGIDGHAGIETAESRADETAMSVRNGNRNETNGRHRFGVAQAEEGGHRAPENGRHGEIEAVLREVDIANTTPVEALCTLNELKRALDDEHGPNSQSRLD